ncbi:NAD-dependent epimerase/dehydratase family protein [Enterococcus sp.]|uniref:NAD-dependent epimerase/dehydratase family protein n=1 Tax=Enterococcus sp. TaxID=35783 RepID=UPI00290A0655|nr:NAD-dependent epimerase/dehydratase family protein [Enterococcus sp.]MDU5336815.1 NAD-dependent epimerase/dehydratase family protein [Enterococcus sp.]
MTEKVLVTGGTGFLGMQMLLQLLNKGYDVRTTVRSLKSKDKVVNTLRENGVTKFDQLSFIEADLSRDDNWDEAMEDRDYVLSVASPVFFEIPKDEAEVIRPAIEGIVRILKAAKRTKVKRVVMTSNFGAVGFTNQDWQSVTTENDWTDENAKGLSAYEKSKLLAEKAAWKFIETEGKGLEFATVNPVAIFGPSLDSHVSGSFDLLKGIASGSMKVIPNIQLNVVDVRDVVDLHIRAMITPEAAGQRFIATTDGMISMPEIAELLRKERPQLAEKISKRTMPNWILKGASHFNATAREGQFMAEMNRNVSNAKAREVLGWTPIGTKEEAVLAAVDSLIKYNLI